MNKLIIIFALALIVSSFAVLGAENTTSTCTDSDGGMNYYEYGYITFFNGKEYVTSKDQCGVSYDNNPSENPNLLNEKSCRSDGQAIENLYECTYGCSDGACKSESTTVKEEVKCVFSNSGSTQSCYTTDNKYKCSGVDTCVVSVSGTKGTSLTWKSTCGGYVYTTIDGYNENAEFACTTQTKSCTDSDGLDMYTKGQVYGPLDAFGSSRQGQVGYANDFCLQMKEGQFPWTYDPEWNDNDVLSNDYTEVCEKECAVYEMICFNNGKAITPSGQASICPAGCKSGACVPTSKPVCGNKICESGEADYCPPCSKEEGIACSCSVGTCPSDCATQKCTDSDGGMNYYEYGYITFFNGKEYVTSKDQCGVSYDNNPSENPNLLNEKSCRSDGQAIENLYECTYGCFEGACKMMPEPTTLKEQVTCIFSNSKATQSCYANNKEGSSCSGYDSCTVTISGEKGTQLTWKSTCGGYAYTTIDGYSKKIGFDCLSSCPEGCSCYEGKIVECTPGAYPCKEGCTCDTHGQVLYCGKNECIDSDGGKNYYEKGYVTMTYPNEVFKDKCAADEASPEKADYYRNLLYETYCYDSKQYAYADYQCPYGCSDGTCKKMELKPTEKPIEIPKKERKDRPAESVKEPPEPSEKDYVCAGCELDDKCYPFGYRKDNKFCSDNYKFTSQIKEEEKCDNNFECSSNLCIDSKCVSSGFIQKILSWFKGFFS